MKDASKAKGTKAKTGARGLAAETSRGHASPHRFDPLLQVSTADGIATVNPQINWDHLTQPQFDEIVEVVLDRIYDLPDTKVDVINGRGGDGGRDVVVKQGNRLRIFQLKYFRDGFPSENRTRRRQIMRSFQGAMQHGPYEWILVIPTTATPGERTFVESLGAEYPTVKIRIFDRTKLNSHLARHPDLVAYFTRDQAREAALAFNHERAILAGGLPDLSERAHGLSRIADTLDPNWGVNTTISDGEVRHSLRPKNRHAADRSPITLSIRGMFGPQDGALATAVRRSLGFGVAEPFTLPAEVVENLTISGPAWLAGSEDHVEVTWRPVRQMPETATSVQLKTFDTAGQLMSSHHANVLHAGSGFLGSSLEMDFYGLATVTLMFGSGAGAQLNGQFGFTQALPPLVLQTARLYRDLQTCAAVEVAIDRSDLGRLTRTRRTMNEQASAQLAVTEMLAEDMVIVQQHCHTYFPVPEELTVDDRIAIRMARLLLEGHCVIYPGANTYTVTLNGLFDEAMRTMFAVDGPVAVTVDANLVIEIGGHHLAIGRVQVFHAQTEIRDKSGLLEALAAGRGAGRKMVLAPIDGRSFRAFLPAARIGRENEPLEVTGWGLPGLDGPPRG